jgi:hypothetical protein
MNRITFKKEPRETGFRAVGHPYQSVNIKLDKKVVGIIHAPHWNSNPPHKWVIRLAVKDKKYPNAGWGWVQLKEHFDSEAEARLFIVLNRNNLLSKYKLHSFEDD